MIKRIKTLDDVVEVIKKDEKNLILSDKTYNGPIITMSDLNMAMKDLLRIENQEHKKRNIPEKRIPINLESSIYICTFTAEAIKNVLNFVKEIDDKLYIESLKLFIGLKEKSIHIYDIYDDDVKKKIKNRELNESSCNNGKGTYVVLNEYLDEKTAKDFSKIVNGDKCSVFEMIKLMHELSHNFDTNINNDVQTRREILETKHKDKFYPITEEYLCETTAVFFETIFGDYLVSQKPELKPIIEEKMKNRILTNLKSVYKTRLKSELVKVSDENNGVPKDFLDKVVGPKKREETEKRLLSDPRLAVSRRYAISMFLVPTMVKVYRENSKKGKERIKEYLKCCKNNDFEGALSSFGINIRDKDNYKQSLENYRAYIEKYLYPKEYLLEQYIIC